VRYAASCSQPTKRVEECELHCSVAVVCCLRFTKLPKRVPFPLRSCISSVRDADAALHPCHCAGPGLEWYAAWYQSSLVARRSWRLTRCPSSSCSGGFGLAEFASYEPSAGPPTSSPTPSTRVSVHGSTAGAPFPSGQPSCGQSSGCENGCPSKTYTVVGTGDEMVATTCSLASYDTRIVLYKGSSCASLTCIGACRHRRREGRAFAAVYSCQGNATLDSPCQARFFLCFAMVQKTTTMRAAFSPK
jgi:hypothetical protein